MHPTLNMDFNALSLPPDASRPSSAVASPITPSCPVNGHRTTAPPPTHGHIALSAEEEAHVLSELLDPAVQKDRRDMLLGLLNPRMRAAAAEVVRQND